MWHDIFRLLQVDVSNAQYFFYSRKYQNCTGKKQAEVIRIYRILRIFGILVLMSWLKFNDLKSL